MNANLFLHTPGRIRSLVADDRPGGRTVILALIASHAIEEVKHDRPLSFETVKGLQLPVKRGVPELVFELFTTCEFGVCKRPCVAHYGP